MVTGLWYTHDPNFGSLSWFWRCKEHPCPLSPHLGLWRILEIPGWGCASLSRIGYGHWSLIYLWSEFWLSLFILKVQRTSMSFKSWFGAFEDAGGSWLGCGILILIWIWSLVFGTLIFRILALYLNFEGANNIHVLQVFIWGFGGHWRFLIRVWHLDLNLDMVPGLWLSIWILKVQTTSMSLESKFGALEDAGGCWLGFGILILIWVWSQIFETLILQTSALLLDFESAKNLHDL